MSNTTDPKSIGYEDVRLFVGHFELIFCFLRLFGDGGADICIFGPNDLAYARFLGAPVHPFDIFI